MIGGVEITTSIHLTITEEDWSGVRSPGRARRRRAQGHPQNIRIFTRPRPDAVSYNDPITGLQTVVMHPETFREFNRRMAEQMVLKADLMREDALYGRL